MDALVRHVCLTCGAQLTRADANLFVCPCCGNKYEEQKRSGSPIDAILTTANSIRESADFNKAEALYRNIIKQYPDADLSDAYWGLFLCEQHCLFETDENGTRFPSFYDIVGDDINSSKSLQNAITQAYSFNAPDKATIYYDLSQQMRDLKFKYTTIRNTQKPYDIFICFKKTASDGKSLTDDYKLAYNLYNHFSRDYNVFFSEESLKNIIVREYEPNIYHALYTAKVMLVLCSQKDYINSRWVKNEWSRYLDMERSSPHTKSIIPILINLDPSLLPPALKSHQGIKSDTSLMLNLSEEIRRMIDPVDKDAEINARIEEMINKRMSSQSAAQKPSEAPRNVGNAKLIADKYFAQSQYNLAQSQYTLCLSDDPNNYYVQFMCVLCDNRGGSVKNPSAFSKAMNNALYSLLFDNLQHPYTTLKQLFEKIAMLFKPDSSTYINILRDGIDYMLDVLLNITKRYALPKENADFFKKELDEFISSQLNSIHPEKAEDLKALEDIGLMQTYLKCRVLIEENDLLQAYYQLSDIRTFGIYDSDSLCDYCELNTREQRYQMAIEAFEQQRFFDAEPIFIQLADNDYQHAKDYLRKTRREIRALDYRRAMELYDQKEYEEALKIFRMVRTGSKHYPESPTGYSDSVKREHDIEDHFADIDVEKAQAFAKDKKWHEAVECYFKIIKGTDLYPPHNDGYKGIDKQFRKQMIDGYFDEQYQKAMELYGSDDPKDWEAAIEAFETLIPGASQKRKDMRSAYTRSYFPLPEGGYKDSVRMIDAIKKKQRIYERKGFEKFNKKFSIAVSVSFAVAAVLLVIFGSMPKFLFRHMPMGAAIAISAVSGVVCLGLIIDSITRSVSSKGFLFKTFMPVLATGVVLIFGAIWFSLAPVAIGIEISTADDLNIINNFEGAHYYITADIDCGGQEITFGDFRYVEGNGHTISNIKISNHYFIANADDISNITFKDIEIEYTDRNSDYDYGCLIREGCNNLINLTFENIVITGSRYKDLYIFGGFQDYGLNCQNIVINCEGFGLCRWD